MNATYRVKRSRRFCTNGRKRRLSSDKRQSRRIARRFENHSLCKDGADYSDCFGGKNGLFTERQVN